MQGRAGLQTGSLQGSRMIAARRTCVRRLEGMLSRWSASPGSSGLMLALLATMPAVAGVASAPPRRGARHVARIDRLALRGGAASPGSPGLMLAPLATGRSAPCRHRGRRGRSPHRHRSCAAARPPSAAPAGGGPQEGVSLITLHWRYRREQIMALAQRRRASLGNARMRILPVLGQLWHPPRKSRRVPARLAVMVCRWGPPSSVSRYARPKVGPRRAGTERLVTTLPSWSHLLTRGGGFDLRMWDVTHYTLRKCLIFLGCDGVTSFVQYERHAASNWIR